MLTYEDMTTYFLQAAANNTVTTHPEYWINSRSLEREFACTCHLGSCEEVEQHSTCTLSFTHATSHHLRSTSPTASPSTAHSSLRPACSHSHKCSKCEQANTAAELS